MKDLDTRWLYIVLVLAILAPMLRPIGIPLKIGTWTKTVYDYVEKLNAGEVVLICSDYTASTDNEIGSIREAMVKQLLKRNVKAVLIAFNSQGVPFSQRITAMYEKAGKTYGTDVVDLGYLAGGEKALTSFFADIKKSTGKDARGTATDSLPILKNIKTLSEIRLIIEMASGVPGPAEYIRQIATYGTPIVFGLSSGLMSSATVYMQSKQSIGIVPGLQGGAEYEKLTGEFGYATSAMDSQSLAYLTYIAAIVLGNAIHFTSKKKPRSKV